jgi:hypothetical protein
MDITIAPTIQVPHVESGRWDFLWICEKWSEEAVTFARKKLGISRHKEISSAQLRQLLIPAEIEEEIPGNMLLNEGIQLILDLLIGAGGTVASNANAQIGVGDSSSAEAATQTDLQAGANKLFKAMNATYPIRTNQTMAWQSDFTSGEANFAWNEWSVRNSSGADKNINRKVQSLGTKASGTWTLTGQVTLA